MAMFKESDKIQLTYQHKHATLHKKKKNAFT